MVGEHFVAAGYHEPLGAKLNNRTEILLNMFNEHCIHGRQHESQRSTVTSIILSISAALVALVSLDDAINKSDIPIGAFLIGVGAFGAIFCAKLYERFRLHMEHVKIYREELQKLDEELKVNDLHWEAENNHTPNATLNKIALNKLWVFLNLFIAFLGLLIVVMGLFS